MTTREQTDESLRAEREKVDHALADDFLAVDETADAVIHEARVRADAVLAKARGKTDRGRSQASSVSLDEQRRTEDRAMGADRRRADTAVRVERRAERAEQQASLAAEREETDRDLLVERGQSDDETTTRNEFVGLVSHDLRNLLHSMSGYASLIETSTLLGPTSEPTLYAQRIQRSASRMGRLIGDLVDVASTEAGALQVTREIGDVSLVVVEAVDVLMPQAKAASITLTLEVAAPTPPVSFDAARILQVLTNLISNAIKFTPAGGVVEVRVQRVASEVHITVRDTGMGIPTDQLEAIFERFVQVRARDRRGFGLGLYISRCIVKGHEGRIWAESVLGAGSCMSIALPVHVPI
jgi:signal transduction histidine kinase